MEGVDKMKGSATTPATPGQLSSIMKGAVINSIHRPVMLVTGEGDDIKQLEFVGTVMIVPEKDPDPIPHIDTIYAIIYDAESDKQVLVILKGGTITISGVTYYAASESLIEGTVGEIVRRVVNARMLNLDTDAVSSDEHKSPDNSPE